MGKAGQRGRGTEGWGVGTARRREAEEGEWSMHQGGAKTKKRDQFAC